MRIDFERTGGFAGLHLSTSVDTRKLPAEERRELEALVTAAEFLHLPPVIASAAPVPDQFHYRITVAVALRRHTVRVDEQAAPDTLQPLLHALTGRARRARSAVSRSP